MIDSNMWIYYFDESLEEHKYVKKSMRKVIMEEEILANTVLIQEVAHYLIRHESRKEPEEWSNILTFAFLASLTMHRLILFSYSH